MKRTKEQIRQDISDFIKLNGIMTLTTQSKDGPWACTVYYGVDNNINLYIVTDPNSTHGKYLKTNNHVAFTIFDSHQKIFNPKAGIQGKGICERVNGLVNSVKALALWHKANPGIEKNITIKDVLKKITDVKIYKITPTYLKFFNKELYSPEEYGILEL